MGHDPQQEAPRRALASRHRRYWTKPNAKEVLKPRHERYLLAVGQPTEPSTS